ncbi:Programmed cell death protein 2-like [Gryllus bimaculatus]|nr:Programmed cell death protein 2-like [Gryllus bimaculatus]
MARKGVKVLLGFEDECITEKHKSLVNFTTNKIGGKPDWPADGISAPICKLCGLSLPLVVQIYAPLENNPHHRTLYLFGCVNPNCWNQNDSWTCIRSQTLEAKSDHEDSSGTVNTLSATDWCCDADDWDDDNNVNNNEENGNIIKAHETSSERLSEDDDEEETESYEDDIRVQLGQLNVNECNANWDEGGGGGGGGRGVAGAQEGGAVGRLHSPSATAEIEGEESEIVSIDTPTAPQHNLIALLQEVAPMPSEISGICNGGSPQFSSSFISVGEEEIAGASATVTPLSEHVRDLLQEYQQNSNDDGSPHHSPEHEKEPGDQLMAEKYEKSVPAHGDKMFHHFVSKIQQCAGQILRYCRDGGGPLLLYPEPNVPTRCQHCRGEMVFELQIIPTLVSRLQLQGVHGGTHLEFGTVLVFCCKRSCWAPGEKTREECVVVQAERI